LRVWYFSFQEIENQGITNGVDSLIGEDEDVWDQRKLMLPCVSLYVLTLCLQRHSEKDSKRESGRGGDEKQNGVRHNDRSK
jgi:hypothetical protein